MENLIERILNLIPFRSKDNHIWSTRPYGFSSPLEKHPLGTLKDCQITPKKYKDVDSTKEIYMGREGFYTVTADNITVKIPSSSCMDYDYFTKTVIPMISKGIKLPEPNRPVIMPSANCHAPPNSENVTLVCDLDVTCPFDNCENTIGDNFNEALVATFDQVLHYCFEIHPDSVHWGIMRPNRFEPDHDTKTVRAGVHIYTNMIMPYGDALTFRNLFREVYSKIIEELFPMTDIKIDDDNVLRTGLRWPHSYKVKGRDKPLSTAGFYEFHPNVDTDEITRRWRTVTLGGFHPVGHNVVKKRESFMDIMPILNIGSSYQSFVAPVTCDASAAEVAFMNNVRSFVCLQLNEQRKYYIEAFKRKRKGSTVKFNGLLFSLSGKWKVCKESCSVIFAVKEKNCAFLAPTTHNPTPCHNSVGNTNYVQVYFNQAGASVSLKCYSQHCRQPFAYPGYTKHIETFLTERPSAKSMYLSKQMDFNIQTTLPLFGITVDMVRMLSGNMSEEGAPPKLENLVISSDLKKRMDDLDQRMRNKWASTPSMFPFLRK